MKIIRNIPGTVRAYASLHLLTRQKAEIERARAAGEDEAERKAILSATGVWGNGILNSFGCDFRVEGRENLPSEGPVVYVCNHQGYADIIALCAALDTIQFGFVAKDDLVRIPLYGKWILRIRSVMMKRDEPREAAKAIIEGIKLIERGYSMVIFPEGRRNKGGPLGEFKQGAFKLAVKPGVPVIPVAVNGTAGVYEDNGIMKGAPITVRVYPALPTRGEGAMSEKELCEKTHEIIATGLDELKESMKQTAL